MLASSFPISFDLTCSSPHEYMMATFASLAMPPMEEAMEMSSPAPGQQYDGDIDILFDDYAAEPPPNDDDHMSEDGDIMRPGTSATDDLMADIDHPHGTSVPTIVEEEMQDSDDALKPAEQQMNDAELIDYEDDEMYVGNPAEGQSVQDATIEEQLQSTTTVATAAVAEESVPASLEAPVEPEHASEKVGGAPEAAAAEIAPESQVEHTGSADALAEDCNTTHAEVIYGENELAQQADSSRPYATEAEAEGGLGYAAVLEPGATETGEDAALPQQQPIDGAVEDQGQKHEADDHETKPPPLHSGTIDMANAYVSEGPPTPTDQTLHAVSIQYRDHMWPLFKSRSQPDGLLKDDNLLNVSLSDLIHELRGRLALKLDGNDTIPESRELVLNFEIFGSTIAEFSVHASAASLNDVLSVYLKLHDNVGISEHDTPPLLITLTTQLNFSNSLTTLKQLAATGAGLPVVEHEEDGYAEEAEEEEAENSQAHPKESTHEDADEPFEDQHEEQAPEDQAGDNEYYQECYYQGDDPADGWDDPDAPKYNETHEAEANDYDEAYSHPEANEAAAEDAVESDLRATESEDTVAPDPHASSAALSAAITHDTTGEHLEDEIDFENDDLTNQLPELGEDRGDDDDSTLLNRYSTEIAEEAADVDDLHEETEDQGVVDPELYPLEFENEDFLQEGDEQYYDEGANTQYDADNHDGQEDAGTADAADSEADRGHGEAQDVSFNANGELSNAEGDEPNYDPAFDLLDDDGNEPFDHDEDSAEVPPQDQGLEHNDEDDIGFDLDDDEDAPATPTSLTPRKGKRSLGEAADEDHIDFDEPEQKKARAD
ncbi:hypothetical protein CERZMDRAFT_104641 [Cercospora zeae-maydis SCOH1-5]|uniref:Uncharacterized protein n=1 Tax=Cercospora zeae-maydis SCOH1-5 TaxID=717836 RepID=A0A6A6FRV1_9PEZI|nr:hypothetical protein CERZMDRAFT_104641 [Cercospora zeae-maydis SCOH1-5]